MLEKPLNKSTKRKDIEIANLLLEITPTMTESLFLKINLKTDLC